jgi:site-specific recombinase XerD
MQFEPKRNLSEKREKRPQKRTKIGLPKVYPYKSKSTPWLVSWRHGGKRDRYYFATKKEAETKRDELERTIYREGAEGVAFGAVARAEYVAASKILLPFGVSLIEAAQDYAKRHRDRSGAKLWKDAAFELREAQERGNRRDRTIKETQNGLRYFAEWTGALTLADFTPDNCENFLASGQWAPSTIARYRASLSVFGTFATRKGWIRENPVAKIGAPKLDRGRPVIYTIDEANALLAEAAKIHGGRIVRRLALLLLCGLRPTEIDHLKPDDILKDAIRIGTGKIRGRRSVRLVRISPAFRAWWDHFPGKNCPVNFRKIYEQAKRNAKITKQGTKLERHTWISAQLAVSKDENAVAREAGNSPDVIFNDYFQLIDEAEAARLGTYCPLTSSEDA